MSDFNLDLSEIKNELKIIRRKLDLIQTTVNEKGHFFIIIALVILLVRSC